MDEGGVLQQVMQENPFTLFFQSAHWEMYPWQTFDFTIYCSYSWNTGKSPKTLPTHFEDTK